MQPQKLIGPFIPLLILLLTLGGCQWWPVSWRQVKVGKQVSIRVPGFLKTSEGLAEEAALQMQNKRRELFLVLRYAHLDSLYERRPGYGTEDYYDFHAANLTEPLREAEASSVDTISIGGLRGLSGSFTGIYGQDRLYFRLLVLEGENHLYQILAWTTQVRRKKLEPIIEEMLGSFRELTPDRKGQGHPSS